MSAKVVGKSFKKIFPATVANADMKSFHTFLIKYFYHMLVQFDQIVWSKVNEILTAYSTTGEEYHHTFFFFLNDRKEWGNNHLDPLPGEFRRFSNGS